MKWKQSFAFYLPQIQFANKRNMIRAFRSKGSKKSIATEKNFDRNLRSYIGGEKIFSQIPAKFNIVILAKCSKLASTAAQIGFTFIPKFQISFHFDFIGKVKQYL